MNTFNELDAQGRVTFLMANNSEQGLLEELQDKNGNNIRLQAGQRLVMECEFIEECFGASDGLPLLKFARASDFSLLTGNRLPRRCNPSGSLNVCDAGQPELPAAMPTNADGYAEVGQVFTVDYTATQDGTAVCIGTQGAASQGKLRINKAAIQTPVQVVIGS